MWREYARVQKTVSSFCMVELQSVGTTGARFRNYGFLQSARRFVLVYSGAGNVRSLFWTGRRIPSSGLVSPCEIRRWKRSCRRSVGSDQ
jgi:hypothetical protein